MTVINVLNTNDLAGGATEYQIVSTGYYRIISAAAASTVSFNDGPAITLIQNEALLVKSGAKVGQARIVKATDSATTVYTLGQHLQQTGSCKDKRHSRHCQG